MLLLQELAAARSAAETGDRRWRVLAEVGQVLSAGRELGAAISQAARLVVPAVAEGFAFYLRGDEELPPMLEVAHRDATLASELRARLPDLFDLTMAGTDRMVPDLRAAYGTTVPLCLGNEVRGLMVLAPADLHFAGALADRLGLALERARMLRQTERAIAARDRAIGIVSHDLRDPLSTIQLCATALLDSEPPPLSGIRRMAQIILRSAGWTHQIVQDLLDHTSLDAGSLVLHREPTIVAEVIDAAKELFAPVAEEQALKLLVDSGGDLPRIDADPHRLLQVLSNLLGNALKFTPAGGQVVVSVRIADQEPIEGAGWDGRAGVRFAVSDNGPGIAPEDLAHVFDWFWQSRRGKRAGAGLGLAIARDLIEAHRGRLRVESVLGRGSTFWFTVPAAVT